MHTRLLTGTGCPAPRDGWYPRLSQPATRSDSTRLLKGNTLGCSCSTSPLNSPVSAGVILFLTLLFPPLFSLPLCPPSPPPYRIVDARRGRSRTARLAACRWPAQPSPAEVGPGRASTSGYPWPGPGLALACRVLGCGGSCVSFRPAGGPGVRPEPRGRRAVRRNDCWELFWHRGEARRAAGQQAHV